MVKPGSFWTERLRVVCVKSLTVRFPGRLWLFVPGPAVAVASPSWRVLTATSRRTDRGVSGGVSVLTKMVSNIGLEGWGVATSPVESVPGCVSSRISSPTSSLASLSGVLIWGRVVSLLRFLRFGAWGGDDGGVDTGSAGSGGVTLNGAVSEFGGRGLKYANIDPRVGWFVSRSLGCFAMGDVVCERPESGVAVPFFSSLAGASRWCS